MNKKQQQALLILILALLVFTVYVYFLVKNIHLKKSSQPLHLPTVSKNSKPLTLENKNQALFSVVHVADGDTIDIERDGQKVRLRLLGINSPESVAPNRPIECFGKESHDYMETLTKNRKVSIQYDSQKPKTDEYGRELVYVFRDDGLFINKTMIEKGYAFEYTYHHEKYQYQNDFKNEEASAKTQKVGLWGDTTCKGKK